MIIRVTTEGARTNDREGSHDEERRNEGTYAEKEKR